MSRFSQHGLDWHVVALLVLTVATGPAAGANSQRETGQAAAAWTDEKGKFRVVVEGQAVANEEFEISRSGNEWVARAKVEISKAGGGPAKLQGKLRLAADGAPLAYEYEWSPAGGKKASATVVFQGGTARLESRKEGGEPLIQEFLFEASAGAGTESAGGNVRPRVAILDNNLYHHYILLARLYGWEKKGAQTFRVLIPQEQIPGAITVEWAGPQEIGVARFDLLRVRSTDLEIELYFDANHRLVRLAVPSSKVEVVRE